MSDNKIQVKFKTFICEEQKKEAKSKRSINWNWIFTVIAHSKSDSVASRTDVEKKRLGHPDSYLINFY